MLGKRQSSIFRDDGLGHVIPNSYQVVLVAGMLSKSLNLWIASPGKQGKRNEEQTAENSVIISLPQ